MMGRVSLIGHRGQPLSFPENSLEGFRHVAEAGAEYVETDIHITADGIPVLSHDANLLKLTGKQIIISDHSYEEIKDMSAGYPERFRDRFLDCRIATLKQFIDLVKSWPDLICFIELKKSSLSYFGDKAVDLTLRELESALDQCVLISFEYDALQYAKDNYKIRMGWVLPEWSAENYQKALALEPEYLFVDVDYCPQEQGELWNGTWQWVAYTINDCEQVGQLAGVGIELLETDNYSELKQVCKNIEVSNDF